MLYLQSVFNYSLIYNLLIKGDLFTIECAHCSDQKKAQNMFIYFD